ncbi:TPA: hypothetical protein N0F65_010798 [Lagenidium giganteum]|uniref:Uncharacterized protein n=1 Tax=Lagenidium giganteum TaxID=4803 RepID=A0AAV2YEW5_9STRA|nr:TPA: hypothetical protein N0F65_010798 [Lagenidium giganteum]
MEPRLRLVEFTSRTTYRSRYTAATSACFVS